MPGGIRFHFVAAWLRLFVQLCSIIVHQTAVEQDLLFVGSEAFDVKGDILHAATLADDLRRNGFGAGFNCLADAGYEHHIAVFIIELGAFRKGEGKDAPVDAVAAVALGGVLIAEVGIAAEHLLAGSGLLISSII